MKTETDLKFYPSIDRFEKQGTTDVDHVAFINGPDPSH